MNFGCNTYCRWLSLLLLLSFGAQVEANVLFRCVILPNVIVLVKTLDTLTLMDESVELLLKFFQLFFIAISSFSFRIMHQRLHF